MYFRNYPVQELHIAVEKNTDYLPYQINDTQKPVYIPCALKTPVFPAMRKFFL